MLNTLKHRMEKKKNGKNGKKRRKKNQGLPLSSQWVV